MKLDYHIHTDYSDDSWYPMEKVVKDAINLGLKEICFTDHVDYGVKLDWTDKGTPKIHKGKEIRNVNYEKYFAEIEDLQIKYYNKINIKSGLEFGVQGHTIDKYEKLVEKYPMDFILLSIHQVRDMEFWTGEFQKGKTDEECYDEYYGEMFKVVENFKGYSCLAHMDLIRRYLDKEVDMFNYNRDIIKKILETVIRDGKGLEFNTSNVRYKVNGLTPSIKILKLYRDLGGEIITIGSDSHKEEDLGFGVDRAKETLREIGFRYFSTFNKMNPKFHKL